MPRHPGLVSSCRRLLTLLIGATWRLTRAGSRRRSTRNGPDICSDLSTTNASNVKVRQEAPSALVRPSLVAKMERMGVVIGFFICCGRSC